MKKSLIAGASVAALGLAVVPFAGVFAADSRTTTDTITVTIAESCTFDGATTHMYTKAMTASTLEAVGETTLAIKCNNAKGYSVTGTFTDLVGPAKASSGNETIAYADTAASAGSGTWNAFVDSSSTPAGKASSTITSKSTMSAATGDSVKIAYKVGTTATQAEGSYTGTASYTLTKAE